MDGNKIALALGAFSAAIRVVDAVEPFGHPGSMKIVVKLGLRREEVIGESDPFWFDGSCPVAEVEALAACLNQARRRAALCALAANAQQVA